ncbi:hypothetical protein DPMN_165019 [Dreissena polymorpha]|uniref:Uncharacterized protein n=1 Tax=Dreissena polymorpha TaxID=45954 RepID=A0A9D4IVZ6_DREPO|nr:hypothetical protein DPMN_165019 [Dreissena polymorpha]
MLMFQQVPNPYERGSGSSSGNSVNRSILSVCDRSSCSGNSATSVMSLRRGEKGRHRNSCAQEAGGE